jgi:hypothetical protein
MAYGQQLSSSAVAVISNAQMLGGITTAGIHGAFNGLPAYDSTSVPGALQPSVLRSEMSGSQSVIHALNKLAASVDSSNDLAFGAGVGGNGSVALASQTFEIAGTTNEIVTTSDTNQTLTISLPDDVTIGDQLTVTGRAVVDSTTDATSKTDGSLQTDGGLSVAKAIFNGTGATLAADSGVVTMGAATSATVSAAGIINVNNVTDATSKTDGSLQTDGGLSVAKAIYNGTGATLAADSGVVTMGAATGATVSAAGIVNVNNVTDATSKTDGSLQTDGGLSVAKKAYIGTGATIEDGGLAVTAGGIEVAAGRVTVDDVTDATSGTDGSLQTDGGLSVAKAAYVGTDLTVAGNDIIFSAAAANIGAAVAANNLTYGASNTRNLFATSDAAVSTGISLGGLATATVMSAVGGVDEALFLGSITGSAAPGTDSTNKRPAISLSSSLDIIQNNAGSTLTAAGRLIGDGQFDNMIPFISIQGADSSGVIRDFKLQVSGGILSVEQFSKLQ